MKSKNMLLVTAILPLVFAASSSVVMWPNESLAAKIAFLSYGVWFGVAFTRWLWVRKEGMN